MLHTSTYVALTPGAKHEQTILVRYHQHNNFYSNYLVDINRTVNTGGRTQTYIEELETKIESLQAQVAVAVENNVKRGVKILKLQAQVAALEKEKAILKMEVNKWYKWVTAFAERLNEPVKDKI